jgi:hypothetical protein
MCTMPLEDLSVTANFSDQSDDILSMPIRPKHMLALGGCTIVTTAEMLQKFMSFHHYWRHNIVCDMSAEIDVSNFPIDDPEMLRILDKYSKKFHRKIIEKGEFDYLVFECASDAAFHYLDVDGAVLLDLRNDIFGPGWGEVSFEGVPQLREAKSVSPNNPAYWELWKDSFDRLYKTLLAGHIRRGKKIIFIKRYLCTQFMGENGPEVINDVSIKERNTHLRRVYDFVDAYDGLITIEPPEELLFTSVHAPFGLWQNHPEQEYYDYVSEAILRICIGDALADHYHLEILARRMRDRVAGKLESSRTIEALQEAVADRDVSLSAQREELSRMQEAVADRDVSLSAQREELSRMQQVVAEQEQRMLQSSVERDELAAKVDMLTRRYAPVRKIYKSLRIGWFKRKLKMLKGRR